MVFGRDMEKLEINWRFRVVEVVRRMEKKVDLLYAVEKMERVEMFPHAFKF
jgi:hypothetical protein